MKFTAKYIGTAPFFLASGLIAIFAVSHDNAKSLPASALADKIIIQKSQHAMFLMDGKTVLKAYAVSLGRRGSGPKVREGDGKVPEGTYRIAGHKPDSRFHYALKISYPELKDIEAARMLGAKPGGDIMIHGMPNGLGWLGPVHRLTDWTAGCIAVTDKEIDEIARAVRDGTPVEIKP
jgi:murein L,D-transpeptidase YafK